VIKCNFKDTREVAGWCGFCGGGGERPS
jgi:hypothetical protein